MGMMSAGLSMIGGLVQGMGAKQQADAEAAAHDYNAAVATRNREVIADQTYAALADKRLENQRILRGIYGKFAANGLTATGSAVDVVIDTAREMELGTERIRYSGKIMQIEEIDKYNLETMAADASRQAGQISMVAGILNGLTGAVSAMSSFSGGGGFGGGFGGGGGFSGGFSPASTAITQMTLPTPRPTDLYRYRLPS